MCCGVFCCFFFFKPSKLLSLIFFVSHYNCGIYSSLLLFLWNGWNVVQYHWRYFTWHFVMFLSLEHTFKKTVDEKHTCIINSKDSSIDFMEVDILEITIPQHFSRHLVLTFFLLNRPIASVVLGLGSLNILMALTHGGIYHSRIGKINFFFNSFVSSGLLLLSFHLTSWIVLLRTFFLLLQCLFFWSNLKKIIISCLWG